MDRWVRTGVILHLCILFTLLAGYAGHPFLQEMLTYKRYLALYHEVMGLATPGIVEHSERLERNRLRFKALSIEQQQAVLDSYSLLQEHSHRSFGDKVGKSVQILTRELPPFAQAWFLFSVCVCILWLFQIEGVAATAWLLPVLALCYAVDGVSQNTPPSKDAVVFPSEAYILEHYLEAPLEPRILDQYTQLQRGWHLYVINEWAEEIPSPDSRSFDLQVERGEFSFNLARIQELPKNSFSGSLAVIEQSSALALLLYVLWNCFFALLVSSPFLYKKRLYDSSYRCTGT